MVQSSPVEVIKSRHISTAHKSVRGENERKREREREREREERERILNETENRQSKLTSFLLQFLDLFSLLLLRRNIGTK